MKQVLPSEILNTLLVGFIGKPYCLRTKLIVDKKGFEKIKPPYILLINHCSANDYKVASTVMFPQALNYVADYNMFVGRKFLMDMMGAIPRRQFYPDKNVIQSIQDVITQNGVVALFPEFKTSVDGTPSIIRPFVSRIIKHMKVPVVMLNISGTYIDKPRFSKTSRGGRVHAALSNLLSEEQVKLYSEEEVQDVISEAFMYDEYEYQRENRIIVNNGALGLHNILYQCPVCNNEFTMSSTKNTLKCNHCGAEWTMGRFGVIVASNNNSNIKSVPEWNFMQRKFTRNQLKNNEYILEGKCTLYTLTDFKGYTYQGKGEFIHDGESFRYTGPMNSKNVQLIFNNNEHYTISFNAGNSVEFASENCIYKFVPEKGQISAKINLAVEEAFKLNESKNETEN